MQIILKEKTRTHLSIEFTLDKIKSVQRIITAFEIAQHSAQRMNGKKGYSDIEDIEERKRTNATRT